MTGFGLGTPALRPLSPSRPTVRTPLFPPSVGAQLPAPTDLELETLDPETSPCDAKARAPHRKPCARWESALATLPAAAAQLEKVG